MDMYRRIIAGRVKFPTHIEPAAQELIVGLLELNPTRRMGCGQHGAAEIKAHKWFAGFDWAAHIEKKIVAPLVPDEKELNSLSNFNQKVRKFEKTEYEDDGTSWDTDF
jgi:hypothetical protein